MKFEPMRKLLTVKLQLQKKKNLKHKTSYLEYNCALFITWRMPTWEALVAFLDDTPFSMAYDITSDIIEILQKQK